MDSKKIKRMPIGSIKLQFAGELILPILPDRALAGLFRRYQVMFENFANMERSERLLNYRMMNGLMLTSFAKKTQDQRKKKELFTLKNNLFIALANDRDSRRKLAFRYLSSKNFRVIKFCPDCEKKNTAAGLSRHQWQFCERCEVDRSFFNVLSMHHKFDNGSITLFLSNDLIKEIKGLNLKNKGKLEDHEEEARFDKYHYNVRNLDAFDLDSITEMHRRLVEL